MLNISPREKITNLLEDTLDDEDRKIEIISDYIHKYPKTKMKEVISDLKTSRPSLRRIAEVLFPLLSDHPVARVISKAHFLKILFPPVLPDQLIKSRFAESMDEGDAGFIIKKIKDMDRVQAEKYLRGLDKKIAEEDRQLEGLRQKYIRGENILVANILALSNPIPTDVFPLSDVLYRRIDIMSERALVPVSYLNKLSVQQKKTFIDLMRRYQELRLYELMNVMVYAGYINENNSINSFDEYINILDQVIKDVLSKDYQNILKYVYKGFKKKKTGFELTGNIKDDWMALFEFAWLERDSFYSVLAVIEEATKQGESVEAYILVWLSINGRREEGVGSEEEFPFIKRAWLDYVKKEFKQLGKLFSHLEQEETP
ncbi:MAG: hypothetical protein KBD63_06055 [Bacteriovoracaceae bacterium]|nr:hypothetical protein [Bacteriovoracaceae bacterium]